MKITKKNTKMKKMTCLFRKELSLFKTRFHHLYVALVIKKYLIFR